jgi:hypothetical protein
MADEFSTEWFGDSKVVGKTGKPLILYRGLTGSSTEGFPDAALAGEPRPGYATFLSDNAKVAASYAAVNDPLGFQAGTIVPVYVKADEVIEFHNTREHGHFNMFEFDRQAKNLRPGQVLVARNVRDPGPHASLEADPDYGWQARADTYAIGPGTQMRSAISKGTTQEPRPPDQSNLPAVIDTASAASQLVRTRADEPRPKGKGAAFRGIGSLMRGKIFPLIQALQRGYELLPEDKKVVGDVLDYLQKTKAHELFGMEKSGLEYLKDWLGMEQPPEGGIITLPEKMYLDFYHGTPNKWSSEEGYPVGRPRLDFKGTGEGAQVYAPGFYGGEARAVGYEYAERLAEEHGEVPNVYKGKIREDIVNNKFIDFNLPVNEQSQDVQEVFKKLGYETKTPDRFAGADILLHMERRMGADAAIDALREEGIVGLRYLDKFSRNNKNLYKGKSLVKQDGKALVLNEGWQQQGREVLQYLVDNNMDMDEFVRQQREFYSQKGKISRALRGARQQEKLMDILEGTTVKKSPLTRNVVVWDQPLLDQIGRTIKKEMAAGGFVTKPLYDDARIGGMI